MFKKNLFKIILVFIVLFLTINISFAKADIDPKVENAVLKFIKKVERKYSIEWEINYLENINSKIYKILEKNSLTSKKEKLLNDILILFNEEIFKQEYIKSLENKSQLFIESNILNELKWNLENIVIPNYLKTTNKQVIKISEKQEYIRNTDIVKIAFSKYYSVNSWNITQFNNKNWIFLINELWKVFFVENYNVEEKIRYSEASKLFKWYITKNTKFFEENNTFYSYNFKWYKFFEDKYWFYKETLKQNNIDFNKSVLYLWENKRYNFIVDYNKIKLINWDIIYWIVDKYNFLQDLVNDKLYLAEDTDELFVKLKNEIINLTKNKKKDEKIKIIYNFILDNIEYTKNLNLEDKKIFSWILAYKNSDGVCEAYVKLMSYALKFAWVKDARVLRWDVIDAPDFPQIWHAWLKIWDLYYDPTFDDPIWASKTKSFLDYKYFWLPKDLLYANRFDYWNTPEYLKSKSLYFRINLVNENLSKLSDKYKDNNYKILEWVKFNKENNIEIWENITIEEAKKIIPFYEVTERTTWEILFYDNWVKKNISKLQYYVVNNTNLWQVLAQLNYDLEWLYLFKWDKNWIVDYRLGFNVIIK